MATTATISITQDEGSVNITADFDPPLSNEDGALHPMSHIAGVRALEAAVEALKPADGDDEPVH